MDSERSLFTDTASEGLNPSDQKRELAELIARYRVTMNQMVARLLYLERQFRRSSDTSCEMVGGFVDAFLESCTSVPDAPEEWDGGKCYTSDEVYASVRQMYVAGRDLRRVAKKVIV